MFTLPKLGYEYDSLVPYLSKEILEVHHDKHHQIYVDKLNAVMGSLPLLQDKSVEYLISNLNELPAEFRTAVKNFGGAIITTQSFGNFYHLMVVVSRVAIWLMQLLRNMDHFNNSKMNLLNNR